MKEMGRSQQLRTGEVLIIVVVLFMWAGECLQVLPHLASGEGRPLSSQEWRQLRGDVSSLALGARWDPFSSLALTRNLAD